MFSLSLKCRQEPNTLPIFEPDSAESVNFVAACGSLEHPIVAENPSRGFFFPNSNPIVCANKLLEKANATTNIKDFFYVVIMTAPTIHVMDQISGLVLGDAPGPALQRLLSFYQPPVASLATSLQFPTAMLDVGGDLNLGLVAVHVDVLPLLLPFRIVDESDWRTSSCAFWATAITAFPRWTYRFFHMVNVVTPQPLFFPEENSLQAWDGPCRSAVEWLLPGIAAKEAAVQLLMGKSSMSWLTERPPALLRIHAANGTVQFFPPLHLFRADHPVVSGNTHPLGSRHVLSWDILHSATQLLLSQKNIAISNLKRNMTMALVAASKFHFQFPRYFPPSLRRGASEGQLMMAKMAQDISIEQSKFAGKWVDGVWTPNGMLSSKFRPLTIFFLEWTLMRRFSIDCSHENICIFDLFAADHPTGFGRRSSSELCDKIAPSRVCFVGDSMCRCFFLR